MPVNTTRGYSVIVSIAQKAFLCMLAERGRSQMLNPNAFKPNAIAGLEDLATKGLVTITHLVHRPEKEYSLTELGVQIVDQIYASQKQSAEVMQFAEDAEGKARKEQEP